MKHEMKMKKIVKERVDYHKSVFVFLSKKDSRCQTSHILFEIESPSAACVIQETINSARAFFTHIT